MYSQDFLTNKFKNPIEVGLSLIIYAKECNKKCKYCLWGDDNSHSKLELDKDLIEATVAHSEDRSIVFYYSGGEPFFDKDTLQYVKYLLNKFTSKFKSVTILSNMDFYEPFEVDFFPVCIIVHNNYKKIYKSKLDGCFVWNTIWVDDIRENSLIYEKDYSYLFRLKLKTSYNEKYIPNEYVDRSLVEKVVEKLSYNSSGVNFVWPHSLHSLNKLKELWSSPNLIYSKHMYQPSGIDRNINRVHACKTCKYNSCSEGIEKDDCGAMNKICYTCPHASICPLTQMFTESVDISYYKDCSTLKWILDLKEQYVRH